MSKFRKEMARWRLVIHIPISTNFSDFFMTKCIRSPISLRRLYLKYPTLPYEDVCNTFLLNKRHLFSTLIVGTKVKGFLLCYSVAYSAREMAGVYRNREFSDAVVTILNDVMPHSVFVDPDSSAIFTCPINGLSHPLPSRNQLRVKRNGKWSTTNRNTFPFYY